MMIGYLRKSEEEKIFSKQVQMISSYPISTYFIEERNHDDQLNQLIQSLGAEDTIVFCQLSDLDKTLGQLGKILGILEQKGISIIFVKEKIEIQDYGCSLFVRIIRLLIKNENQVLSRRATQALEKNRETRQTAGRPKIKKEQKEQIYSLYYQQHRSMREIAQECKLALGTVHKYIRLFDNEK